MKSFMPKKGEKFIEHIRNIGIEVEWETNLRLKGLTKLKDFLLSSPTQQFILRINNLNFNRIILLFSGGGGLDAISRIIFTVNHHIDSISGENPIAKTDLKIKRSILRDKILGFDWIRGKKDNSYPLSDRLCEVLNKDEKLNNYLLTRFKNTMDEIIIWQYEEERFIGIQMGSYGSYSFDYLLKYTSKLDLEAYDTIAKHIKDA